MSMDKSALVFTGDIGFDNYMDGMWRDKDLLAKEVKEFLQSGDHLIVNVEGALSKGDKNVLSNSVVALMHSMNPEVGDFLEDLGADIWSLANNHIMDAGPVGMRDTLDIAKAKNVKTIGAGMNVTEAATPIYLEEAGGIGMFAVGYQRGCKKATEEDPGSLAWNEMDRIESVIREIKAKCRWCIVVAHGGEEFTALPSPYTRDRYLEYLNMGADIVVSHHPHVPMNYELVGTNKAIFYSLGNFIFDTNYQRAQYNTEKGILLKLNLDENEFSFEALGLKINRENEHIEKAELPLIFEDVQASEYELLEPLSAKAFVNATKRQQRYLFPDKYNDNTTEEEWEENFNNPKRSGRVIGEGLDFYIIRPIAAKAELGLWQQSKLENVKKFILDSIV